MFSNNIAEMPTEENQLSVHTLPKKTGTLFWLFAFSKVCAFAHGAAYLTQTLRQDRFTRRWRAQAQAGVVPDKPRIELVI